MGMTEGYGRGLSEVFNPRSIAVVGASNDPTKFGGRAYLAFKKMGFPGKLFAVNSRTDVVGGQRSFKSILEIEDEVDFAVITVPAEQVIESVEQCSKKGVKGVEILSAGFSETATREGLQRELALEKMASQTCMRIIGPNCFGVYSPEGGLTILPGVDFPKESGPVGLFAQSGGFTAQLVRKAVELGIRFSQAVSYGNAVDVNECDLLAYFFEDQKTELIVSYLEGVRDGRAFVRLLRDTARRKPVVIWKGGLTEQGSRAVESHTASMAGEEVIWNGIFSQTSVVKAGSWNEVLDLIVGFLCLKGFRGSRYAVVSGGGAITVAASDAFDREGLVIPKFPDAVQRAIREYLPPYGNSVNNPVDLGSPIFDPEVLGSILQVIARSGLVDALVVEQWVLKFLPHFQEELARSLWEIQRRWKLPVVVTLPQASASKDEIDVERGRREYRQWYISHGMAVFDGVEEAARALGKVIAYNERKSRCPAEGGFTRQGQAAI